jgi:hypothetical protein
VPLQGLSREDGFGRENWCFSQMLVEVVAREVASMRFEAVTIVVTRPHGYRN